MQGCCDALFFRYSFACGTSVPARDQGHDVGGSAKEPFNEVAPMTTAMMAVPRERAVQAVAPAQFADGDLIICRTARRGKLKIPGIFHFFTLRF